MLACALPLAACAGGADIDGDKSSFGSGGPGGNQTSNGDSMTSGPGGPTSGDSNSGFVTSGGSSSGTGGGGGGNCIDLDGDDFGEGCIAGDDCDDDNVDINPAAMERCDEVDWNCDGEPNTGCECADDGVGSNCNLPFDLGVLTVGGMKMGVVGNVPVENNFDWYQVSFPSEGARPGEGTPTISFAINEGDQFVFDVLTDQCGAGGMPCGNAGAPEGLAEGLTEFTFIDDDPGCCTEPMHALVSWPDLVYIRVYRTTQGSSCSAYQLQVSR